MSELQKQERAMGSAQKDAEDEARRKAAAKKKDALHKLGLEIMKQAANKRQEREQVAFLAKDIAEEEAEMRKRAKKKEELHNLGLGIIKAARRAAEQPQKALQALGTESKATPVSRRQNKSLRRVNVEAAMHLVKEGAAVTAGTIDRYYVLKAREERNSIRATWQMASGSAMPDDSSSLN